MKKSKTYGTAVKVNISLLFMVCSFKICLLAQDFQPIEFQLKGENISLAEITLDHKNIILYDKKELQLIKYDKKERAVLWRMNVPDDRLSGTGYGLIRATAFYKTENDNAYIAIVRNYNRPELIVLKIANDEHSIIVTPKLFSAIYIPSSDITKMILTPSDDDTIMHLQIETKDDQVLFLKLDHGNSYAENPTLNGKI